MPGSAAPLSSFVRSRPGHPLGGSRPAQRRRVGGRSRLETGASDVPWIVAIPGQRTIRGTRTEPVLGVGLVRPVRGREGQPEEERPLGGLGAVQKGDHVVSEDLLRVAFCRSQLSGTTVGQVGVQIRARATRQPGADVGKPAVPGLGPTMPFAHEQGAVTRPGEQPGQGRQIMEAVGVLDIGMLILIAIPTMLVGRQAGEQCASTGRTLGDVDRGLAEPDARPGQAIESRGLDRPVAGNSKRIPAMVVGDDEHNIGPAGRGVRGDRARDQGQACTNPDVKVQPGACIGPLRRKTCSPSIRWRRE